MADPRAAILPRVQIDPKIGPSFSKLCTRVSERSIISKSALEEYLAIPSPQTPLPLKKYISLGKIQNLALADAPAKQRRNSLRCARQVNLTSLDLPVICQGLDQAAIPSHPLSPDPPHSKKH